MSKDSLSSPSIETLRDKIDSIDDQVLELLNQRAEIVMEVGKLKIAIRPHNPSMRMASREKSILKRLEEKNTGPFPFSSIKLIFKDIFKMCLELQK
ncbi:MAG: chorismate mutase [Holophagaceae bacterium]|nr:chorismate mutase [Holophagaceae bacterium]